MAELLFTKKVDQSVLKAGIAIPQLMQERIQNSLGIYLQKGQKETIRIKIENQYYDATFTNLDLADKYPDRVVFQIRYSEGSPLCSYLKKCFKASNDIIQMQISQGQKVEIPSNIVESIEIYALGNKQLDLFVKLHQTAF